MTRQDLHRAMRRTSAWAALGGLVVTIGYFGWQMVVGAEPAPSAADVIGSLVIVVASAVGVGLVLCLRWTSLDRLREAIGLGRAALYMLGILLGMVVVIAAGNAVTSMG